MFNKNQSFNNQMTFLLQGTLTQSMFLEVKLYHLVLFFLCLELVNFSFVSACSSGSDEDNNESGQQYIKVETEDEASFSKNTLEELRFESVYKNINDDFYGDNESNSGNYDLGTENNENGLENYKKLYEKRISSTLEQDYDEECEGDSIIIYVGESIELDGLEGKEEEKKEDPNGLLVPVRANVDENEAIGIVNAEALEAYENFIIDLEIRIRNAEALEALKNFIIFIFFRVLPLISIGWVLYFILLVVQKHTGKKIPVQI